MCGDNLIDKIDNNLMLSGSEINNITLLKFNVIDVKY